MLSREHAPMSSILEDLVSRSEHWRCLDGLKKGEDRSAVVRVSTDSVSHGAKGSLALETLLYLHEFPAALMV